MGEQVAGAAGYGWLDGVRSDLESESYACDGVDIPACAANAPHIRSRLYWVAMDNTQSKRLERRFDNSTKPSIETRNSNIGTTSCDSHDMADADCEQLRGGHAREPIIPSSSNEGEAWERQRVWVDAGADGDVIASDMADTQSIGRRQGTEDIRGLSEGNRQEGTTRRFTVNNYSLNVANADDAGRQGRTVYAKCSDEQSAWSQSVEWRRGADGKTRRVKSGLCLLAHGVPARVGKLRAYGNAIVPPLAAEVIKAFMETL
jgi:DNA (cytosine-5)-methyltransferase 1